MASTSIFLHPRYRASIILVDVGGSIRHAHTSLPEACISIIHLSLAVPVTEESSRKPHTVYGWDGLRTCLQVGRFRNSICHNLIDIIEE